LKHTSTTIRPPADCISLVYVLGGCLLLVFTAILFFVMPWTEYSWHFDRFPCGGTDFELGLLSLLAIFLLVLVLLQQRRQNVALLLTVRRCLSLAFEGADPGAVTNACNLIADSDVVLLSSRALCRYNLPIQV
jgi:hypothetical protein